MANHYINADFDNTIIDAIYELMLRYFQNNVSFHGIILDLKTEEDVDADLYNKDWQYDRIGRVIYNNIHIDREEDVEITIGLSKNYDKFFIESDVRGGRSIDVYVKNRSLGGIVDNISEEILNIEDRLMKGIEDRFLV